MSTRAYYQRLEAFHSKLKADGSAICYKCGVIRSIAEYAPSLMICKLCHRATGLMKYGLTHDDYDRMLEAQGGVCAICGTDDPGGRSAVKFFSVDHCHKTGKVRGLLCASCNRGIGYLDDDAERVQAAANYLKEYKNG